MESAPSLKRLTLELGGNDAGIVLPDADPKAIAEGLFWGSFINSGQTCACLKRLYVHDSIYDDVCRELTAYASAVPVGDGLSETSALGPVQNRMQFDIVSLLRKPAPRADGILLGGNPDGGPGFSTP
jgi:acyl-CoA reductase-like NAD-dependent aldehyde dehydrogenase